MLDPKQNRVRTRLDTSGLWQFQLDPREGEAPGWFRVLPAPRPMAVPGRWNDLFADARDYLGLAWYLTEAWVPSAWRGVVRARQSLRLREVSGKHLQTLKNKWAFEDFPSFALAEKESIFGGDIIGDCT